MVLPYTFRLNSLNIIKSAWNLISKNIPCSVIVTDGSFLIQKKSNLGTELKKCTAKPSNCYVVGRDGIFSFYTWPKKKPRKCQYLGPGEQMKFTIDTPV